MCISAQGQIAAGSTANIDISADHLEYIGSKAVLTGAVDVRQGDTRVIADKMDIYMSGSGGLGDGDFERIVAKGNFYYLTPDQEVRGNEGIYTKIDDTFTVTGNVILVQQGGNVITGDKLYYNLTTQKARVVGSCQGRRCGSKGRVNILIKGTQNTTSGTVQSQNGDS
jgi:lipopolysaccharide export system protein LptA